MNETQDDMPEVTRKAIEAACIPPELRPGRREMTDHKVLFFVPPEARNECHGNDLLNLARPHPPEVNEVVDREEAKEGSLREVDLEGVTQPG
jgi:hypothetical protein